MCSIFGFIARRDDASPSARALQAIVRGNIGRGPHAFGFAWIDRRGRLCMYKQTGRLTDDLGVLALARDAKMLVGHLRYATHGDASENINNHPHPADGGWIVHNGVVRNYRELVAGLGLLTVSECDSEVLGRLLELSEAKTLAARAAAAVRQTEGSLAMLGLWARPATMIAARRGNPLHYSSAAEGMYLATLPAGLPGIKVESVADDRVLQISRRAGRISISTTKLPTPPRDLSDGLPFWATCDSGGAGIGGRPATEYRGG